MFPRFTCYEYSPSANLLMLPLCTHTHTVCVCGCIWRYTHSVHIDAQVRQISSIDRQTLFVYWFQRLLQKPLNSGDGNQITSLAVAQRTAMWGYGKLWTQHCDTAQKKQISFGVGSTEALYTRYRKWQKHRIQHWLFLRWSIVSCSKHPWEEHCRESQKGYTGKWQRLQKGLKTKSKGKSLRELNMDTGRLRGKRTKGHSF